MESGKPELDWVSYTNTTQELSAVDFKNLGESNISLDKSAIIKNQSSSHQSSTSNQSKDNTYSQDVLKVLGPYPFYCPPGFNGFLQVGNVNRFKTSLTKTEQIIHHSQIMYKIQVLKNCF